MWSSVQPNEGGCCQIVGMRGCQIVGMRGCQIVGMRGCQIVGLGAAK